MLGSLRRSVVAVTIASALIVGLAGCSGSSSTAANSTSTTVATNACKFEYQAAASKLNGIARYFSQAAQDGQMNAQFAQFAANYVDAMKTFDAAVLALDCPAAVKAELAGLVTAQEALEPLVAQFTGASRPPVAEFNAAAQAVAEAVRRVNTALGIS
ncbi:MAG: hypothetical protein F2520_03140 [Actinobacteria bacterium]|uniref:Unannotated protein n=1 Tax=freshwater metagenome TaxID=449393 RepID=A0A6J5Y9N8_9ZZZZ|nr:hypothetical protein [Actinomycetota bacterium]MTA77239.1 hypothetical protein [Actinomycetota bacterium]